MYQVQRKLCLVLTQKEVLGELKLHFAPSNY